uniref:Tc1-like transposase DDE domain-containing protein n=1 Tax=Astyanax mexicanus TaxID=7994 RepID=A0A3B1KFI9_ASTMX
MQLQWTDMTKVERFGRCVTHYMWQKKNIILNIKHGGGSVMVWGCFAVLGPGQLDVIDGTMNSAVYQTILEKESIRPSVRDLKLRCTWVLQQDNDPKHTNNLIEMLWQDLKQADMSGCEISN